MTIIATRLADSPIIYPHMDGRMGDNINGASVVRAPDWLPDPLGRYYLYFADHKGSYIRLAFADALTGPWTVHTPGALELVDSLFEPVNPPEPPESERPSWADTLRGNYLYAHIASPDVHVDDINRCFRMYYHGLLHTGDQQSRLAVSADGLGFRPLAPLLGPPYLRAFTHGDFVYAITWGGEIWRSPFWEGPFERGLHLLPYPLGDGDGFRHGEVHNAGDRLYVFFTCVGDRPERILYVEVDLSLPWKRWVASEPVELLQPELAWEGADLPLARSTLGGAGERLRELRDPCVFLDSDGAVYLFYSGGGESGIGVARLD